MNSLRLLFANPSARLLAVAGACALTSGCVADPFKDSKVDPASPVAADVARMSRANTDYPSFSEIPALPKDVRPLRLFGQAAEDLKVAAVELEQATAPGTWTLNGTDEFAASARRDVGPELPPPSPSDAEAFARELRERATPPPPR
jgi:hypothetical protein